MGLPTQLLHCEVLTLKKLNALNSYCRFHRGQQFEDGDLNKKYPSYNFLAEFTQ